MNETVKGSRAEGSDCWTGEHLRPECNASAPAGRHGIPKTEPVSKINLQQRRLRATHQRAGSRAELPDAVEKSLRRAALWDEVKDQLHKSAHALSGGQQQRLCIARALAVNPEVLLLDEPSSALDPIATSKIEELLFELKKACTIVIVTHNMQQAARISDRTGFFLLGHLLEINDTAAMFRNPARKETEDYITGRFG